jgi:XTP/dITP diphosphohydrolase
MMKLLIATGNEGKFNEIKRKLEDLPFEFCKLDFLIPDEVEDGTTYEENAEKKARYCALKMNTMTLADDSGLIVEALKDQLGVFTRRWGAGPSVSDEEWLAHFMEIMKDETNRKAKFVSCICLVDPTGKVLTTSRGEIEGTLARTIEAPIKSGIPLSSIFTPNGTDKVHSAMSIEEKNKIGHRGKALVRIKTYLEKYFNMQTDS